MPSVYGVLLVTTLFQAFAVAAPADNIPNVETTKPDVEPNSLTEEDVNKNNAATQGQRLKRNYNYFGYGFPPMNPIIYPNYPNREEIGGSNFGYEDPFAQIYKRLQDIVHAVRQPNLPPPPLVFPPQLPIFFPVIYIPQIGCGCIPERPSPDNQKPTPSTPTKPPMNNSDVDISNRFPDMEDERQNWGFVINETELDDGLGDDFTRPISFEPIRPPNRPTSRPPPPVEHGSSQAGSTRELTTTTTTVRPNNPDANSVTSNPIAPENPSACDGAVLSCCHQPQVTYDCFAAQGCPDPTSYGNPCDVQVILRVIDRFQRFYGQRTD